MPYLKNLPSDGALYEVFRAYPKPAKALLAHHQELLRAEDSPLTVAERELIAAYTSGLNACSYCHGIHTTTAEAFGVEAGLLEALLRDLDTAPVDEKLRPLLRYARKLTLTPSRMSPADAEAVFAVGWDDRALFETVSICALFNCMNRLVEGLGVVGPAGYTEKSAKRLHDIGYDGLWNEIEAEIEAERETS